MASELPRRYPDGAPGVPVDLSGTRPLLDKNAPRTVAPVGVGVPLASSGHDAAVLAALPGAWTRYLSAFGDADRARFYGTVVDAFEAPHTVGACMHYRAWIQHAAVEMWGTIVALPRGAPKQAHAAGTAASDVADGATRGERFDFVEISLDEPVPYRVLAQLCAIFTVPTRSGGTGGGAGRESFVLVRYLTRPQEGPPAAAAGVELRYNERRFFANKNGNPSTTPFYRVESLESVSRSWPVRPRFVSRAGHAIVVDGFFSPKVLYAIVLLSRLFSPRFRRSSTAEQRVSSGRPPPFHRTCTTPAPPLVATWWCGARARASTTPDAGLVVE